MKYVLAIDQGTTGSTCLLIDGRARIVGRGYREITQHFPRPGWVEHDASEILDRTVAAASDAIREAGVVPDCIGITNQRETVVVWNRKTGRPVCNAIVWQDRRTADRCAALASREAEISALTGLVVDPYFSATKLEWILADDRIATMARDGELAAGTIDSWLIWKLTGGAVHATEPTNASRTMLYDINRAEWSQPLLDLFGVPRSMLPEVRPSAGDFGTCDEMYFGSPIPIRGVAGDQQAALFGQGCWERGSSKNTYGTGAFLLLNTGSERPPAPENPRADGLLTTVACDERGGAVFALEASIFIAGAAVQWLRDGLGIIDSASETEGLARSIQSTDGVCFVPALAGLGAPHWEPAARGLICGLTRGTGRAHLVRATLESMAYGTRDVLELMTSRFAGDPAARTGSPLRVDGGAAANGWLMQFQADLLGVPVERPNSVETTALGAAGLAGIETGVWKDGAAFISAVEFTRFQPGSRADTESAATGYLQWQRAVRAALHWARDVAG